MSDTPQLKSALHGDVLVLTISNPSARNAFHPDIYRAGVEAMQRATTDPAVAAVVICGEGGTFCAGGNLKGILERRAQGPEVQHASLGVLHGWITLIRDCPKPVVAAAQGHAAGAGFGLVLACDVIVADEGTRFIMSHVKIGLSPDGGGSWFLARLLPRPLALELMWDGSVIAAERLHQLGVVNRVVPKGAAVDEAIAWAQRLAKQPRGALASIKQLANAAPFNSLSHQLDAERENFIRNQRAPDCEEGIKAFFEKREPRFNQPG